jgi:hypothetical protein
MEIIKGAFEGWKLNDNGLYSPEGIHWTPKHLYRWHWDKQRLRELEKQCNTPAQHLLIFD